MKKMLYYQPINRLRYCLISQMNNSIPITRMAASDLDACPQKINITLSPEWQSALLSHVQNK